MGFNKPPDSKANIKANGKKRWHQGFYEIKNVDKYIGDPTKCVFRSKWEFHFMVWCDLNPSIKRWSSEFITIPYQDENGKYHRYFPDFYIEIVDKNEPMKLEKIVVEIKPYKETQMPVEPSKKSSVKVWESYEYQLRTFQKNLYKWTKAKNWCEKNGLKFLLLTEIHLKQNKIM